jgi:hypothetical protein
MSKEEYPGDVKSLDNAGFHGVTPLPTRRRPWWKLGGVDYSFVSVDAGYGKTASATSSDTQLDTVEEHGRHVWNTDEAKDIYKPIEGYEGAHRFDPNLTWDPEEEKKLVRQVSTVSVLSFTGQAMSTLTKLFR